MRARFWTSAIVVALAAPFTHAPLHAQKAPTADGPGAAVDAGSAAPAAGDDVLRRTQEEAELRSDWIQGTTVATPDGQTIGTIEDLLIDRETGEVKGAVLSVGGFLGIGAKSIAVKWRDLAMRYDGSEIILPLSRAEAEAAPAFESRDPQ